MNESMGIQTLARRTGVTAHTLRYYEDAGLMIDVPRGDNGHRRYDERHTRWVAFLRRLRDAGMGIGQIRSYVELLDSDRAADRARRLEILRAHREDVRARIAGLQEHLAILDQKVDAGCAP